MSTRPTLLDFIDDELLRAPMTIDHAIDAVQERWRVRMPVQSRADADPTRVLFYHRGDIVRHALASLRSSALADLQSPSPAAAAAQRPIDPVAAPSPSLSLIGEDDVALDIEIARCAEMARVEAEIELRELQTYTAALVDDVNVSRDTNPFRPDRFVRALWAGVQTLPMSDAMKAAFLRDAAAPLAGALRQAYAAACRRLEEQGVTPANFRTVVSIGHSTWDASLSRFRPPDDLQRLRDSMPTPLDALAKPAAVATSPPHSRSSALPGAPDPQLIELLARLFEAIQNDFGLAPDTVALLQRLQPTTLRVALRDPALLGRYDHALWRFMDQLTHDIEISTPAQRTRMLGLGRHLVDHLANTEAPDRHGFAWALERLLAAQRQSLNQAVAMAGADIARLQRIADANATPDTSSMPLDIGSLDTVPAALLDTPSTEAAPSMLGASGLPLGSLLRAYLQGEWRTLQALWQDDQHELALLRELATDRRWALRQGALARLMGEGLARRYHVRSLVRRAAEKVLRAL